MEINVKSISGSTTAILIEHNDTILSLKLKVKLDTEIPIEQQRLVFSGKVLSNNEMKIADCGIKNGDTLHMAISLRGG